MADDVVWVKNAISRGGIGEHHVSHNVCMCMCVINENKHSFQDFRYLISYTILIYLLAFIYLHHVRLLSYVFMRKVCDEIWRD